jgi:hypothetical protein
MVVLSTWRSGNCLGTSISGKRLVAVSGDMDDPPSSCESVQPLLGDEDMAVVLVMAVGHDCDGVVMFVGVVVSRGSRWS